MFSGKKVSEHSVAIVCLAGLMTVNRIGFRTVQDRGRALSPNSFADPGWHGFGKSRVFQRLFPQFEKSVDEGGNEGLS